MKIKSTAVVGLGALGTMFAEAFHNKMENTWVIADQNRISRYLREGIYFNGEKCDFHFLSPEEATATMDLILVCTKFHHLEQAIEDMRPFVGENTLILSMINGISSEILLSDAFGAEKVIYCVAQGMSAVKLGNELICKAKGFLAIGEGNGQPSDRVNRVASCFDEVGIAYEISKDIIHHMWGKLMANVGCNQVCAVFDGGYGVYQEEGEAREAFIAAMREVMAVAACEKIILTESDLDYWIGILDSLPPDGMPSMRQDVIAKRKTEVELFAGTITALGREYHIPTPVNQFLLEKLLERESVE